MTTSEHRIISQSGYKIFDWADTKFELNGQTIDGVLSDFDIASKEATIRTYMTSNLFQCLASVGEFAFTYQNVKYIFRYDEVYLDKVWTELQDSVPINQIVFRAKESDGLVPWVNI